MFDEYLEPPRVERAISPAPAVPTPVNSASTPSSTTIDQDAPSLSHSPSSSVLQSPSLQQGIAAESTIIEANPVAPVNNIPFLNMFAPEHSSEASSSGDVSSTESPYVTQTHEHLRKWTVSHPIDNIIGNPSRPGVRAKSSLKPWSLEHKSRAGCVLEPLIYTMADVNVNVPAEQAPSMVPPTRTNEQIVPRIRWVPVGKSNCYLDVERSQTNLIYKIAVDIMKQTNFFRAFTASLTISAIYIQQFWDTIGYDRITEGYKYQLDEQWFDLTKEILRDALQITPVDNNKAFSSPPTPDALIKFVNDLGYPKTVIHLSDVMTNDMFQPWRALTTIINLCLTGKTSGFERPRALFHPRPESPLHVPTKELIMGYLKFSVKGTKMEVFGMPIPNELISNDIQGADYYDAYLEKVAKHQRYLAGEEVSDPDSPAPKPAKSTKPKHLVDEFVDEGVPVTEPRFGDLEADTQRAIEESLKEVQGTHRDPLPLMVFRETDPRKLQPLLEDQGKGKEKVGEEQATQVLINLQTLKKKSHVEQYILQRRTPVPTRPSVHDDSSFLYAELGMSDSDMKSDEEVPPVVKSGAQDEGQAGPNPGKQDEGQAGPNPGNDTVSQPQSTPVVHAGPNLEHTDVEVTDASSQPQREQMDEGFIATAYPSIQENLKLTVDKHLGDQFFNDKPSEADNEKMTADTKAESMVSVTIHQDTSEIPIMTLPVINVTSRPDSPNIHQLLPTTATATTTTTTTITTLPLPLHPQQSATDSILIKRIGELEQHMADLVQANLALEERMDKQGSRLYKLENLDIPHQVSKAVGEIVTDVVNWALQAPLRDRFRDLPEADMKEILHHRMWESNSYQAHKIIRNSRKKKKKRQDSPKTPPGSPPHQPPPLPLAGLSGALGTSGASGSSQVPSPPSPLSTNQGVQSTSTAAISSSKTAASAKYTA
ncbi:hypothetical protein Tco_0519336 [Tanacetum coccineum]